MGGDGVRHSYEGSVDSMGERVIHGEYGQAF